MVEKKLKVGFFCDTFYPMVDGVIKVLDNYATLLSEKCEVIVFVPEGRRKFEDKFPYKVVRCKYLRVFGLDYDLSAPDLDRHFMKILKQSKLDIVHVHSPFTIGNVGLKYARKHGIPCVATMHSQFKRDFERNLKTPLAKPLISFMMYKLRRFFDSTTENWTVNKEVARIYHEDYGVRDLPRIIPNGTDMFFFTDKNYVDELRKRYDIKEGVKVLLFVGRINLLKNLDFLVNSLSVLKKDKFPFKAILVGDGQDVHSIKRLIAKHGLENDVLMPGKITDRHELAAHYALADLFVFPSLYDANSLVQIEAASQRTPTLFLEGAATASNVIPEVNGYLAKPEVVSYAHKVEEIFADNARYAQVCSRAFSDLYVSWQEVVEMVYRRYIELLHG